MADIRLESEAVYARFRKVLLASRRDVLAKLAFVPVDLQARRRWLYRGLEQIDGMLKTQVRVEGRKMVVTSPGIATALGKQVPVGQLYRSGMEDAGQRLGIGIAINNNDILSYAANYEFGWLKNLEDDVRFKVSQSIRTGVLLGEGTDKIARRLVGGGLARGTWPSIESRARTIARTETARIIVNGRVDGYKEMEVEELIVTGRATACPVCSALIGKVYKIDEVPEWPPHPNCVHDLAPYKRKGMVLG